MEELTLTPLPAPLDKISPRAMRSIVRLPRAKVHVHVKGLRRRKYGKGKERKEKEKEWELILSMRHLFHFLGRAETFQLRGVAAGFRDSTTRAITTLDMSTRFSAVRSEICPLLSFATLFSSIEILNLKNCRNIAGDLADLQGLNRLKHLTLSNCYKLKGNVKSLGGFTHLRTLNIDGLLPMNFEGKLQSLSKLNDLKEISCQNCFKLTGDLNGLPHRLTSLNLSGCSGLSSNGLENLQQLRILVVAFTSVLADLRPITGLTKLQLLDCQHCFDLQGDLGPVRELTELTSVNLAVCKKLTGSLEPFESTKKLEQLNLRHCRLLQPSMFEVRSLAKQTKKLNLQGLALTTAIGGVLPF